MKRIRKPYHDLFRLKLTRGVYSVIYRDMPGKTYSTGCTTEAEAVDWSYRHIENRPSTIPTLGNFTEGFFSRNSPWVQRQLKKGRTFNPEYLSQQQGRLQNYILPGFKHYLLPAITTRMIDESLLNLISARTGKPASNEVKIKTLRAWRIILGEAKYQGYLKDNPAAAVDPFSEDYTERIPFTLAETKKLFPDDESELLKIWLSWMWASYFYMMLTCGLRPGEAGAIRWEQWNRELHGTCVEEALETKSRKPKGLKTDKKGSRGVKYKPAKFTPRLEWMLDKWQKECSKIGGLMFTIDGKPFKDETTRKHLIGALKRAEVPRNGRVPYCFRHTYTTELLKIANLKAVQEMVGHTTLKSTMQYNHPDIESLLRKADPMRDFQTEIFG